MSALFVPYAAAAVLLLVAGVPKVLDPGPTSRAAEQAGLPSSPVLVRLLGAAEAAVGAAALLVGGLLPTLAVAGFYLAFAGIVTRALLRGDVESCGCFNADDSPPSALHVVVDVGLALAALAVLVTPGSSWVALASTDGAQALVTGVLALAVAGLGYLVMARLPHVEAPVERPAELPAGAAA